MTDHQFEWLAKRLQTRVCVLEGVGKETPFFVGILLRFSTVENMAVIEILHEFDGAGYVVEDSLGVHIFRVDQIAGYPC